MTDGPPPPASETAAPPNPAASKDVPVDTTFRSGSMTAISVLVGFSLSFLIRWAGLPGPWHLFDLAALAAIVLGSLCQIGALANLLSVRSLVLANYNRMVRTFLIGLALVAAGVALALIGDLIGLEQHVLGG